MAAVFEMFTAVGFCVQFFSTGAPDTRNLPAGAKPQAKTLNHNVVSGHISCIRINGYWNELYNHE